MSAALLADIGIAIAVYASTNIDDLLILAVFFANPQVRAGAVVAGHFLGLAVLVLASAGAAMLALAVPGEWIALLGLVPLALGLRLLPALFVRGGHADDQRGEALGAQPVRSGFFAQSLTVAGVTVANGGDNLGAYIPLFASAPQTLGTYVAVFAVMIAVWCALGYLTVNNPLIGERIRRHGHVLMPLVLIALGLYILADAVRLIR